MIGDVYEIAREEVNRQRTYYEGRVPTGVEVMARWILSIKPVFEAAKAQEKAAERYVVSESGRTSAEGMAWLRATTATEQAIRALDEVK